MSRTKICFVTREYAHPDMGKTGGIGVFVKQFTASLQHYDFDITVFSFGSHPIRFTDDGVQIVKIKDLSAFNEAIKTPLRRYKVPGYISIKKILEFFNRVYISISLSFYALWNQFDLIEFHDYGGDAPYFVGKMPKVVRCHGSAVTLHQFMGYYKRQPDAFFEYQFFKRFNKHVVAVSNASALMTQEAFQLKIMPTVIYNGVHIPAKGIANDYMAYPTRRCCIFYFGSVRERKGIDIACRVFNEIIEDFPEATFHVMGNNNNDYWNTDAKPILSKKAVAQTTYYGAIPNENIIDYLKKAHVVLFPSFGENFSVALLEVMALGKLVVTSNIPAFREIIKNGNNGFIAHEETDYYGYIKSIFNSELDEKKVAEHAIQTLLKQFDMDDIIKQNIIYYKSLL